MKEKDFNEIYRNYQSINIDENVDKLITKLHKNWNELDASIQEASNKRVLLIDKAIEDVEEFFILLKYCYSGYDYFSKFIEFDDIKDAIINKISEYKEIDNDGLLEIISSKLKPYINDGHFSMFVSNTECRLLKTHFAYVTGVVVEEYTDNSYIVVQGKRELRKGKKILKTHLQGKILPTLPYKNKKRYLIGIYSSEEIKQISVNNISLDTYIIKSDSYANNEVGHEEILKEYKNYNVFQNRTYLYQDSYGKNPKTNERLEKFKTIGIKCRSKDITIWDIGSNNGGNSEYPSHFILGLNSYANWKQHCAVIKGPSIIKKDNKKSYEIYDGAEYDLSKADYEGTLYVIINKLVASSGEAAISYARSVKNVKYIGSATAGLILYLAAEN